MKFMEPFAQEDLVVLAPIPDYPDRKEVEVSKEAWPLICAVVQSVTIALESGASPMASRLFPNRRPHGAIEPVLLFIYFSIELQSLADSAESLAGLVGSYKPWHHEI